MVHRNGRFLMKSTRICFTVIISLPSKMIKSSRLTGRKQRSQMLNWLPLRRFNSKRRRLDLSQVILIVCNDLNKQKQVPAVFVWLNKIYNRQKGQSEKWIVPFVYSRPTSNVMRFSFVPVNHLSDASNKCHPLLFHLFLQALNSFDF